MLSKVKIFLHKSSVFLLFSLITAIIVSTSCLAVSAKPTLIIDPGHGGLDGGAVATDGTPESEINLAISQKMFCLAQLFGCNAVLTRESQNLPYPDDTATIHAKKVWDTQNRVCLINETENAVLVSVHQNKFPDARPSGTQVFFGKAETSDALALITHQNLLENLCPDNRRMAAPISKNVYLMNHVNCPAILVECGFLSNPEETKKLNCDDYRTELALILLSSYLQYLSDI